MRTKDLVEKTGLDRETLRFYENKGLIPKPSRTSSGYRNYTGEALSQIKFITKAKNAGFTLREILELTKLKSKKVSCRNGRELALLKLKELQKKQKALKEMQTILKTFVEACESGGEKGLDEPCHLSFGQVCKNKTRKGP